MNDSNTTLRDKEADKIPSLVVAAILLSKSILWGIVTMVIVNGPFFVLELYLAIVGGHNGIDGIYQIPILNTTIQTLSPLIIVGWIGGFVWEYRKYRVGHDLSPLKQDSQDRTSHVILGLLAWSALGATAMVVFILP